MILGSMGSCFCYANLWYITIIPTLLEKRSGIVNILNINVNRGEKMQFLSSQNCTMSRRSCFQIL